MNADREPQNWLLHHKNDKQYIAVTAGRTGPAPNRRQNMFNL